MELVQISRELYNISKRLDKASKNLHKMAKEKAEKEYEYRMNLAKEIVMLRAEGYPATLINDVARGNVAHLKLERDLAKDTYKAAISSLEAIMSQQTALQSILKYQEEV